METISYSNKIFTQKSAEYKHIHRSQKKKLYKLIVALYYIKRIIYFIIYIKKNQTSLDRRDCHLQINKSLNKETMGSHQERDNCPSITDSLQRFCLQFPRDLTIKKYNPPKSARIIYYSMMTSQLKINFK